MKNKGRQTMANLHETARLGSEIARKTKALHDKGVKLDKETRDALHKALSHAHDTVHKHYHDRFGEHRTDKGHV